MGYLLKHYQLYMNLDKQSYYCKILNSLERGKIYWKSIKFILKYIKIIFPD